MLSVAKRARRTLEAIGLVDALRMADGRTISPYRLTLAMRSIAGLRRFQIIQEGFGSFLVRIETQRAFEDSVPGAVRRALAEVVDPGVSIEIRNEPDLSPPPGRKFRVVECRLGQTGRP